jgi:hypothetical protein
MRRPLSSSVAQAALATAHSSEESLRGRVEQLEQERQRLAQDKSNAAINFQQRQVRS